MSNPRPEIPFKTPVMLELDAGTYWYCRCGKSQEQLFYDNSHRAVGIFAPLEFTLDRTRQVKLCRCRHTGIPPYCDKTHLDLD